MAAEPSIGPDGSFLLPQGPIVITGPTGWLGRSLVAQFAASIGPEWRSRVSLFASCEREEVAPDGEAVRVRSLESVTAADVEGALVFHLAYLTKDKVERLGEAEFLLTNAAIDEVLLGALASARPRGVFVASSGAAADASSGKDRHPYGRAKLEQEERFLRYEQRHGSRVVAARLFNLAGPYINKWTSYALSSFLLQALSDRRIAVEATVPVYRSYLHVLDVCELVTRMLAHDHPTPGVAVDLCGPLVVEMADVAKAAADAAGVPHSSIVRGPIDHSRASVYLGDPTFAMTRAGQLGLALRNFETQVADTAAYLQEARQLTSPDG